jgi:CXXX repeat modification system protein
MKVKVGQVTEKEKNEIQSLFERKNGLTELSKVLTADNKDLYEKLIKDMGETSSKFQTWWDTMSNKYKWKRAEKGNWEIDFNTCDIYLIENK